MIPVLYSGTESNFISNGLGSLFDAVSCIVTEERNGVYELLMQYPIDGIHFNDIGLSKIIFAKPSETKDPQPFSIYKISKPINGIVTIYAEHISYRLCYIPIKPFSKSGAVNVLNALLANSVENCPFTVYTDITDTESIYSQTLPHSFRECLGGVEGSVLEVFGGEFEWDIFNIRLWQNRGSNSGVRIAYGKNLTDVTQEESIESTITGLFPYWADSEGNLVNCITADNPSGVIYSNNHESFPYNRTVAIDFSSSFEEQPTQEELEAAAELYINTYEIGVPNVNLDVSFVPLWQTEEYKNIAPLERVSLCDTVTVEFTNLGVNATAKVIKTEYDVLVERYRKITLGNAKSTLSRTISSIAETVKNVDTKDYITDSKLRAALNAQGNLINGALGGNVIINRDGNGLPYEIIVGDNADVNQMIKCIKINYQGVGFSQNGPNGPYTMAMTIDGQLNAECIGGGKIDGNLIDAGTINANCLTVQAKSDILGDVGDRLNKLETDGVSSVKTEIATLDRNGLTVSQDGSEMETNINHDGMLIRKNGQTVLTANNQGVDAQNLHATTYLIVGNNSRFEDWGNYTACFWIGS